MHIISDKKNHNIYYDKYYIIWMLYSIPPITLEVSFTKRSFNGQSIYLNYNVFHLKVFTINYLPGILKSVFISSVFIFHCSHRKYNSSTRFIGYQNHVPKTTYILAHLEVKVNPNTI